MWLKSNLLRKGFFLSAIFFLGVLFSCKDDGALVPEFNASSLGVLDTIITVTSSTVYGDSIRTDRVSRSLFGKLNDGTFGLSSSEFYTQFLMPSSSLNTDPLTPEDIDSVVLILAYDGAYGFSSTQDIIVYELADTLGSNTEYYSDDSIAIKPVILGTGKISLDPSILSDTGVVRIRLSDELGKNIVNPDSGGGEFSTQAEWLNFFKGVKVSAGSIDPIQGDGAIVYFNLLDSRTKLNVYFTSPGDSSQFSFIVAPEAQRFAHFDHDHSSTLLEADIDNTTSESNYLASLGASRIRLSFDDLEQLSADLGIIAINRAELIFPFEDPVITQYTAPDKTVVIMRGDEGNWILPTDWTKNGSDYFGGELDLVSNQYKFNLASTFHEMINLGDYERELFLSVSGNSVVGNRVIMNSGGNTKRKMYVHLTYTKK